MKFLWQERKTLTKKGPIKIPNEPIQSKLLGKDQNRNKWGLLERRLSPPLVTVLPESNSSPTLTKTHLQKMWDCERWSCSRRARQCCWYPARRLEDGILLSCTYTHSACERLWCSSKPWNTWQTDPHRSPWVRVQKQRPTFAKTSSHPRFPGLLDLQNLALLHGFLL